MNKKRDDCIPSGLSRHPLSGWKGSLSNRYEILFMQDRLLEHQQDPVSGGLRTRFVRYGIPRCSGAEGEARFLI
jgi:hypothetical protein